MIMVYFPSVNLFLLIVLFFIAKIYKDYADFVGVSDRILVLTKTFFVFPL